MSRHRLLLALCALAVVVLVGCKEPIGLPEKELTGLPKTLDAASIEYRCTIPRYVQGPPQMYEKWAGKFFHNPLGYGRGAGRWIDTEYLESVDSRSVGFCVLQVPSITCWTPEPIEVTLHFYQDIGYGRHPIGVVNIPHEPLLDPRIDENIPRVYEYIWYHRLPRSDDDEFGLTTEYRSEPNRHWTPDTVKSEFAQYIIDMAFSGGGEVYLGWVYRGYVDGAFNRNWGNDWSGYPEEYKGAYVRIGTPQ